MQQKIWVFELGKAPDSKEVESFPVNFFEGGKKILHFINLCDLKNLIYYYEENFSTTVFGSSTCYVGPKIRTVTGEKPGTTKYRAGRYERKDNGH